MEPGGQLNMQELLQQAQAMQEQLFAAQRELAEAEVKGTAGGGLVTATVNGQGEVTGLSIDPKAIDADDPADTAETIADLVLAAIRDAAREAAELQQQKMGPLAAGLGGGGGIPGLGGGAPGGGGLPGGFPGLGG
ncbi:YbaB/EbfC family nucleoid-associated protein [Actinomadura sp. OS1-43]|uniref:YbaB/EbfC family nucleoid-associated protein n=2 Tax=Actinomadura sp. OS1-43 TaxID=604315 RepID=UPI00255B0FE8|nr:YbaB/EbfC family nucleoid-associated protein [Actinomadura sp. OS1-43]MDL4816638.1 YbaB/EbfC family nucleoid-associated protein [Actinomadura sp. OS1-43]